MPLTHEQHAANGDYQKAIDALLITMRRTYTKPLGTATRYDLSRNFARLYDEYSEGLKRAGK